MARYEFLKGLPVVTMMEGKQVGKVDDLVVDPERKAVRWLRLHRGGMLGGERLWVSVAAVHGFGEDALIVNAEADLLVPDAAPEAAALVKAKHQVIGAEVMSDTGERLGEVRDYEFAPDSFVLTSLSVPDGMNVVGPSLTITADRIITIGEDMIVVAAASTGRPEEATNITEETTTTLIQEKTE
jgi:uncharacterized protein YrrD